MFNLELEGLMNGCPDGPVRQSSPDGRARPGKYFVYILWFVKDRTKYIGYTGDLHRRIKEHLKGKGQYTSRKGVFKLVYVEVFDTKREAKAKEKYFKSRVGRRYLISKLG